jgi:hypothetical protein
MKILNDGDEIAILPHLRSSPSEVLGIAKVTHAGELFIKVEDGRMFATSSGLGLNTHGCIEFVTDAHRAALHTSPLWRKQRHSKHRIMAVNQPRSREESVYSPMPLSLGT